jgi:hypothetical protein
MTPSAYRAFGYWNLRSLSPAKTGVRLTPLDKNAASRTQAPGTVCIGTEHGSYSDLPFLPDKLLRHYHSTHPGIRYDCEEPGATNETPNRELKIASQSAPNLGSMWRSRTYATEAGSMYMRMLTECVEG